MTTDQLLNAFIAAGFDTPAKVQGLLSMASAQMTRNAKLIAIDALNNEHAAAAQAIEAKRQQLQSDVDAITAQITGAVS
jgi:hypothetical protein